MLCYYCTKSKHVQNQTMMVYKSKHDVVVQNQSMLLLYKVNACYCCTKSKHDVVVQSQSITSTTTCLDWVHVAIIEV